MTNIKTTLASCGNAKLLHPMDSEDEIVAQCLMDVNLSKLLDEDVSVFEGILRDVFPEATLHKNLNNSIGFDAMNNIYIEECQEKSLQPVDAFFTKLMQMYEVLQLRQAIILIGDPFSGKSVMIKLLSKILGLLDDEKPLHRSCQLGILYYSAPHEYF